MEQSERFSEAPENHQIPMRRVASQGCHQQRRNGLIVWITNEAEIIGSVVGDETENSEAKPFLNAKRRESDELARATQSKDKWLRRWGLEVEACPRPGVAQECILLREPLVKRVPFGLQRLQATEGPNDLDFELARVGVGWRQRNVHEPRYCPYSGSAMQLQLVNYRSPGAIESVPGFCTGLQHLRCQSRPPVQLRNRPAFVGPCCLELLRGVHPWLRMDEGYASRGGVLDQPFIFVCQLLVDLARDVGRGRLRAASLGLLPEQQVIDVHSALRLLRAPVEALIGIGA